MRLGLIALLAGMGLAAGLVLVAGVMGVGLLALGAITDDMLETAAQVFS